MEDDELLRDVDDELLLYVVLRCCEPCVPRKAEPRDDDDCDCTPSVRRLELLPEFTLPVPRELPGAVVPRLTEPGVRLGSVPFTVVPAPLVPREPPTELSP